jgi:ATP-dependent RNA helicase DDX20
MSASVRQRTSDIVGGGGGSVSNESKLMFRDLLLSSEILRALEEGKFDAPSPVQMAAIPLGRLGIDLIAQAKSGTGKTIVFVIVALEAMRASIASAGRVQALVLTPTREIAAQVADVVRVVGRHVDGLACGTFVGGIPLATDVALLGKRCNFAVGTPGRVRQLIEKGALVTDDVTLFVLDEADRLMDEQFSETTRWISSRLPPSSRRQTLAFSATYSDDTLRAIASLMRDPQRITMSGGNPQLIGVRQYYADVQDYSQNQFDTSGIVDRAVAAAIEDTSSSSSLQQQEQQRQFRERFTVLSDLLRRVPFQQCVVFCETTERTQLLAQRLVDSGWQAAAISSSSSQRERERVMRMFRDGSTTLLVSTDLTGFLKKNMIMGIDDCNIRTLHALLFVSCAIVFVVVARGVDVTNVNFVVQFDGTNSLSTYFHRVGRAGRYGT